MLIFLLLVLVILLVNCLLLLVNDVYNQSTS